MKIRAVHFALLLAGVGVAAALSSPRAAHSLGAEAMYLERGTMAGVAAFFTSGIPTCGGDFARYYVQRAVDDSALVMQSKSHAASTGVTDVAETALAQSRSCSGKVTFADGTFIPVAFTITPRGFHDYLVTTTAKPTTGGV